MFVFSIVSKTFEQSVENSLNLESGANDLKNKYKVRLNFSKKFKYQCIASNSREKIVYFDLSFKNLPLHFLALVVRRLLQYGDSWLQIIEKTVLQKFVCLKS